MIPMNFLWLKYHQIRFVSFGIWFLGLFLTDFTSIINSPNDGWNEVIQYIQIISMLHACFVAIFFIYLFARYFIDIETDAPNWKMIIHSLYDLSIHLDIGALLFCNNFSKSSNAFYQVEVFIILDAILAFYLTPYKRWRAMVDLFGVLPSVALGHYSTTKKVNSLIVFAPVCVVLLMPLLFTVFTLSFSNHISSFSLSIIRKFDPSLLPNRISIPVSRPINENLIDHHSSVHSRTDPPPQISEKATSGDETDYFDFKSVPFSIVATYLFHYAIFAEGMHHNTMVVMGHYFLALASILINTRVVAFPAIILTNVVDSTVQFNSVWPELSFV